MRHGKNGVTQCNETTILNDSFVPLHALLFWLRIEWWIHVSSWITSCEINFFWVTSVSFEKFFRKLCTVLVLAFSTPVWQTLCSYAEMHKIFIAQKSYYENFLCNGIFYCIDFFIVFKDRGTGHTMGHRRLTEHAGRGRKPGKDCVIWNITMAKVKRWEKWTSSKEWERKHAEKIKGRSAVEEGKDAAACGSEWLIVNDQINELLSC